ncbi:hypothetical protein [Streptacidiphilus cavernicola]|uniref:DUF397 domain-containing protein n=1 Tax=Streptacidiphilus cavernicola TaxID=3342716 RepID=A0ABV6VR81_9ACTN
MCKTAKDVGLEGIMALRFIGIDPDTGGGNSPTVWFDEEAREFVFQGWKPNDDLRQRITETPAPNHAPGIPFEAVWDRAIPHGQYVIR